MNEPEDWRTEAACHQTDDAELFFPSANTARVNAPKARAICATCPQHIVTQCAREALDLRNGYGVWAGVYLGETANTRQHARSRLRAIAGVEYSGTTPVEVAS